jgi:hypothetical protein
MVILSQGESNVSEIIIFLRLLYDLSIYVSIIRHQNTPQFYIQMVKTRIFRSSAEHRNINRHFCVFRMCTARRKCFKMWLIWIKTIEIQWTPQFWTSRDSTSVSRLRIFRLVWHRKRFDEFNLFRHVSFVLYCIRNILRNFYLFDNRNNENKRKQVFCFDL